MPGGHLDVLFLEGVDHLHHGQVPLGQLERIQPDAHAVILLPQENHVAYPFQPSQPILVLNGGVIAELELAVEG